jgi:hypothetical protein
MRILANVVSEEPEEDAACSVECGGSEPDEEGSIDPMGSRAGPCGPIVHGRPQGRTTARRRVPIEMEHIEVRTCGEVEARLRCVGWWMGRVIRYCPTSTP